MKKIFVSVFIAALIMLSAVVPACAIDDSKKAELEAEGYAEEFISAVSETEDPVVCVTGGEGKVGDIISVEIQFGNAAGFTSGEFVLQYNPYRLQFEGFKESESMRASKIFIQTTEETGPGVKDIDGNIAHEVYIAMLHMEEFPTTLDFCRVGTVYFKIIGGGECPLELTAMSCDMKDKEVDAKAVSNVVRCEGEEGSDWDYDAITTSVMTVPTGKYEISDSKKLSTPIKAIIVVLVIAAVGAVIFFVARNGSLIDESDKVKSADGDGKKPTNGAVPEKGGADGDKEDSSEIKKDPDADK